MKGGEIELNQGRFLPAGQYTRISPLQIGDAKGTVYNVPEYISPLQNNQSEG